MLSGQTLLKRRGYESVRQKHGLCFDLANKPIGDGWNRQMNQVCGEP